jgi:hypothetical protein
MWTAGEEPVVNAIRELRPGHWLASEGEVVDGVLVIRPIRRRRRCCGDELYVIAGAPSHLSNVRMVPATLQALRRSYSIGPRLPRGWVSALAPVCIELYCDYIAAVGDAYGRGV